MPAGHSIRPFPADIDRFRFGDWLSGFTDGEGTFLLTWVKGGKAQQYRTPRSEFSICTRADDLNALRLIRSYFGCGYTRWGHLEHPDSARKPRITFGVNLNADLRLLIIPHFERHPLRAKKQRDFLIWKQAVLLQASVICRAESHGGKGYFVKRWTDAERAEFEKYRQSLKAVRVYDADLVCPEELQPTRRPGRPRKARG